MKRLAALFAILGLALHGLGTIPAARAGGGLRVPICTGQGIVWRVVDERPSQPRTPPAPPCCRFGLCCGWSDGTGPLPAAPAIATPRWSPADRPAVPARRLHARPRSRAHAPRAPPARPARSV